MFYPNFCIFQDLSSGKVKEICGHEKGLYLLNQNTSHEITLVVNNTGHLASASSNIDINLWHKIFGHVSTKVLNQLLPIMIDTIAEVIIKC